MADEPKPADGHKNFFEVIFIILILMVVGGVIEDRGWDRLFFSDENASHEEREIGPVSRLFGPGDIGIGKVAIAKGLISVRSIPGGLTIGTQTKRTIGVIKEGPFEAYGTNWWRVDFKESPDGWVNEKFITANVSGYRASQIIPIMYDLLKPIGIFLSIILLLLLIYIISKRNKAYFFAQKKIKIETEQSTETPNKANEVSNDENVEAEDVIKNKRWDKVEELIVSHNINDWKQAIIEADIILDEMLTKMNYDGETVAERLKNVEESDFVTLNKAWEAHKIRNRIAHSGADFVLDKTEAERVINLYRQVFKEFFYI